MNEKETMEKLLEKQTRYAKWQCILLSAAALCCAGVFLLALSVLPQIRSLAGQMETALSELEQLKGQTETVLVNLDAVTGELAQADLNGMVADVDAFVTTGQSAVEQVTEKLDILDLETLNRAIKDLADVVEPLARFFNVFH